MIAVEIAYNKPTSQSSVWDGLKSNWGAQFAVNGKANCENKAGPVAATKNEDQPWLKIDLQGTFLIKTVIVNQRNGKLY